MKEKLTYKQAQQKALKEEWVATPCPQGEECWCRIIEPEKPILYGDNDEEYYIVGSASIPKEEAEYIVKLHNQQLMVKFAAK